MKECFLGFRRLDHRPLVYGHRGARARAPENTLRAFALAHAEGADGVELDVRLDAAREVVVLHDRSLSRVTQGEDTREVERMTTRELRRADVGGEPPPLLREVLEWGKDTGMRVNVEIKSDVADRRLLVSRVVALVSAAKHEGVLISSFHPGMVLQASRALPQTPVAWLVHENQLLLRRAPFWQRLGAAGVHPQASLVRAVQLATWKQRGALVNAWTVNDPDVAVQLASMGVDGIITDDPRSVLRALGESST